MTFRGVGKAYCKYKIELLCLIFLADFSTHKVPKSQSHIIQCLAIVPNLNLVVVQPCKLNENNIYGSVDEQLKITKNYSKIYEARSQILNDFQED